jgi:hypothetical protein
VQAAFEAIQSNWRYCRSLRPLSGSTVNWRWRIPQLAISALNASPEVVLERALMAICERRGRADWSNQVPIASGVAGSSAERRCAIDLVHQRGPGHFELIELKVASDTPLYAAIEIISYTCIWLLSRIDRAQGAGPLLSADRIDARVLAPTSYYPRYDLRALEVQLDHELRALGAAYGVDLSFGFESFPDALWRTPFSDEGLVALLDGRGRL